MSKRVPSKSKIARVVGGGIFEKILENETVQLLIFFILLFFFSNNVEY